MYAAAELQLRYSGGKTVKLSCNKADVVMFLTSVAHGNWVTIQAAKGNDPEYETLIRTLCGHLREKKPDLFYVTIIIDDALSTYVEDFCFTHADVEYGKLAAIKLHD